MSVRLPVRLAVWLSAHLVSTIYEPNARPVRSIRGSNLPWSRSDDAIDDLGCSELALALRHITALRSLYFRLLSSQTSWKTFLFRKEHGAPSALCVMPVENM